MPTPWGSIHPFILRKSPYAEVETIELKTSGGYMPKQCLHWAIAC